MKNKKAIIEMAKEFQHVGDCMVHAEMRNGGRVERIICGDIIAMLNCICSLVDRVATKTGQDFNSTLSAVKGIQMIGYKEAAKNSYDIDFIEEDSEVAEREEFERAIRQSIVNEIEDAEFMIKDLQKKIESKEEQLKLVKESYERVLKSKDKQLKDLTKECKALEHRMKEMEERNTFCLSE